MNYGKQVYQLALTMIEGIGDVTIKSLVSYCGGAENVFRSKKKDLLRIAGIDEVRASAILKFNQWREAEAEWDFVQKKGIQMHFYLDDSYPARLKALMDAPAVLFSMGNFTFNQSRIIAIVGTRHATEYGKKITNQLVEQLATYSCLIVSGLAYGIDIIAHKAAVKFQMPTIAVLGHGLNRLYPAQHKSTAQKMLAYGGLVTEFKSSDKFEPQNFPKRNRIVAGLADATIVVESAESGGALITAEIADSYGRDVFAIPGRADDEYSKGCNLLISSNKANLLLDGNQLALLMGWNHVTPVKQVQRNLFSELNAVEQKIADVLRDSGQLHIDELSYRTSLFGSQMASALLTLELKGLVASLPGKVYRLN
jgi:DNA processing protein